MAVKKPKPKKFKQARKDAKSAAKSTFSGKSQARLKDPKLRLTADDKEALDEMKKMAKSDLGDKAYLNKKEYDAQQRAAREEFRSKMRAEFGEYGGKTASEADAQAPKRTMTEKAKTNVKKTLGKGGNKTRTFVQATELKPQGKVLKKKPAQGVGGTAGTAAKPKPGLMDQIKKDVAKSNAKNPKMDKSLRKVTTNGRTIFVDKETGQRNLRIDEETPKKPAGKGYSAGKSLTTEAGKARYNELIKQGVKPKSAMNKALFFESKKSGTKPTSSLPKMTTEQMKAQNKKALDGLKKDIEKVKKSSTPSKTPKYVQSTRVTGKELAIRPKAGVVVAKEATKAAAKKGLLRTAAGLAGKAVTGKVGLALTAGSMVAGPLLDQLNKNAKSGKVSGVTTTGRGGGATGFAPTKPKAKKVLPSSHILKKTSYVETTASGKRYLGSAHASSAGLKNKTIVGSGGSTYTVKKGDTLSGIAKTAGVSLADVRAANPTLMKKPKYDKGNMIFAGTKVKLPTKKK